MLAFSWACNQAVSNDSVINVLFVIPLSFPKEPIDIILAKCTLQKKVLRQDQATRLLPPQMSEPRLQKPKRTRRSSPNIINTPNWPNSFLAIISEEFYCDDIRCLHRQNNTVIAKG